MTTRLPIHHPGYIATLSVAVCMLLTPFASRAADLTIIVNNVQQEDGQIMLGLFHGAENFPKTNSHGTSAPAKERNSAGQVLLTLKGLAPGQYAASSYHDRDGNSKLSTNMMGMPTEPYGFSNNARGLFGPPSFKDAAILVGGEDLTIEITVQ
jgi:uncharacterized protein (DUF2141 family)